MGKEEGMERGEEGIEGERMKEGVDRRYTKEFESVFEIEIGISHHYMSAND